MFDPTKVNADSCFAKTPEEAQRKKQEQETNLGLSDYHINVHFNDQDERVCKSFILTGVDTNGTLFFTANGSSSNTVVQTVEMIVKTLSGLQMMIESLRKAGALVNPIEEILTELVKVVPENPEVN